jgi:hypothetical protein
MRVFGEAGLVFYLLEMNALCIEAAMLCYLL